MKKIAPKPNEQMLPNDPTNGQPDIHLFSKHFPASGRTLSVKPVALKLHVDTIHRWANLPYSSRFWQMQGSKTELYNHYVQKLQGTRYRIFFLCQGDRPIALLEVYRAIDDEIARYYAADKNDYGIHLLMAPYRELADLSPGKLKGLSADVLLTGLFFLFSFPSVERIIAEPDKNNTPACTLAFKTGFRLLKEIAMSYKNANLFGYSKNDFLSDHP